MAGVTDKSYLFSFSEAVTAGDATRAIGLVASLRESSIDMKRLCEELITHYRTVMLLGAGAGELGLSLSAEDRERYQAEAKRVPLAAAVTAMRLLGDCLDRMGRGTDPRIELELALFNLCGLPAVPAAAPASKAAVQPAAPSVFAAAEKAVSAPAVPQGAGAACTVCRAAARSPAAAGRFRRGDTGRGGAALCILAPGNCPVRAERPHGARLPCGQQRLSSGAAGAHRRQRTVFEVYEDQ